MVSCSMCIQTCFRNHFGSIHLGPGAKPIALTRAIDSIMKTSQSLPALLGRLPDDGTVHVLYLLRFNRHPKELQDAIREDANANKLVYESNSFGRRAIPHMSIDPKFVMAVHTHVVDLEKGGRSPNAIAYRLVCDAATRDRIRAITKQMRGALRCRLVDRDEQSFTITINDGPGR